MLNSSSLKVKFPANFDSRHLYSASIAAGAWRALWERRRKISVKSSIQTWNSDFKGHNASHFAEIIELSWFCRYAFDGAVYPSSTQQMPLRHSNWMTAKFWYLCDDKTEFVHFGNPKRLSENYDYEFSIGNARLKAPPVFKSMSLFEPQ